MITGSLLSIVLVGCKPTPVASTDVLPTDPTPTDTAATPPPTQPTLRGALDAPIFVPPADEIVGFFQQQRLGVRVHAAAASDGTERFVISSSPVTPDPSVDTFPPTPGELIVYEAEAVRARIRGTIAGFGHVYGHPFDLDGDGDHEVLVGGGGTVHLFPTNLMGTPVPHQVALWTADQSDYPPDHPLRTQRIAGPGDWFGLENDVLVGTSYDATMVFDFESPPGPASATDVVPGFLRNVWRWTPGHTSIVTTVAGQHWALQAVGGTLDGQTWTNFAVGEQDSLERGFTIHAEEGTPHLIMKDVEARSIVAKPLDDADSPPYTLLEEITTPGGVEVGFRGGAMAIGHFDDDDLDDLAVVTGYRDVAIWLGPLEGTLTDTDPDLVFHAPQSEETPFGSFLAAADLDGDGVDELAVSAANHGPGTVYIYRDLFEER